MPVSGQNVNYRNALSGVRTIVVHDVLHGLPCIEGIRVSVIHVYDVFVGGAEPAEVTDVFDLTLGRVYEVFTYYYDRPDEIRAVRKREEFALEELERRTIDPPVERRDVR